MKIKDHHSNEVSLTVTCFVFKSTYLPDNVFVPQIERPILSDKSTITSILIAPTTLTSYRKRNLLLAKLVRKEHEGLIGK